MDNPPHQPTCGPRRDDLHPALGRDHELGATVLLFVVEIRMPPGGGPPLMHRHEPGEIYYVLEGEFTFYVGRGDDAVERVRAKVGDVVPLAGRTPHTIRNETDREAVAFVVHSPGPVMEGFMRAVTERDVVDMDAVLELAQRHGIEMLGPIPEIP